MSPMIQWHQDTEQGSSFTVGHKYLINMWNISRGILLCILLVPSYILIYWAIFNLPDISYWISTHVLPAKCRSFNIAVIQPVIKNPFCSGKTSSSHASTACLIHKWMMMGRTEINTRPNLSCTHDAILKKTPKNVSKTQLKKFSVY